MTTKKLIDDLHTNNPVWLNLSDFETVCFVLAREFFSFNQPIPDFSTRSPGVLESCLETPLQQFDNNDLYITFEDKLSILFYLLIKNHPFTNGNKRMAITAVLVTLFLNGYWLKTTPSNFYDIAVAVASSDRINKTKDLNMIRNFITNYLVSVK